MVVAEAPGEQEALKGVPLVGRAGERFDILLRTAGLDRSTLFITNILKHRPPKNRRPRVKEVRACAPFLERQLALVQPQVILALGSTAAEYFDKSTRISRDHGKPRWLSERSLLLVPMWHPAAAFYSSDGANKWAMMVEDWRNLQEVLREFQAPPLPVPIHYTLETDATTAQLLTATPLFGFDLETTSPQRRSAGRTYLAKEEAEIVGYSVAWAPGQAAYIPTKPRLVCGMLESPLWEKVCHNSGFEYGVLRQAGVTLTNFQDTKIAAWLLQKPSSHLKSLARQELGRDPITFEQVTQGRDMSELEPEEVVDYAAADSDNTLMLWKKLKPELKEAGLWELYRDVEMPVVPVVAEMEERGVLVDEAEAFVVLAEIQAEVEMTRAGVYSLGLPSNYNLGSTDQIALALEDLGAPLSERTEVKQQLKTDDEKLRGLIELGWMPGLCQAILNFRSSRKMLAYVRQYIDLQGADGRLHSHFVQAGDEHEEDSTEGPVTGRFSSVGPNLENQPKRRGGRWVKRLRSCIVPTPGHILFAADIGQEEPRIAAYVAQERQMLRDLREGVPLYGRFAGGIYGRPISKQDDPLEWNIGKQCVLSFIWGSEGARAWAPRLVELDREIRRGDTRVITLATAEKAYRRLSAIYPDLAPWRQRVWKQLREYGYVRDYYGRRRLIPKVFNMSRQQQREGWREGMNFLIQGPAASVLKLGMRRVWEQFRHEGLAARLLIPIHDEIVGECPVAELDRVADILCGLTEGLFPVPLPVEVSAGPNWAEMTVIKG